MGNNNNITIIYNNNNITLIRTKNRPTRTGNNTKTPKSQRGAGSLEDFERAGCQRKQDQRTLDEARCRRRLKPKKHSASFALFFVPVPLLLILFINQLFVAFSYFPSFLFLS